MLLDRSLKRVVMSDNDPVRIQRSLQEFRRHWFAGDPELHRIIVDGKSNTENFRAWISRILVSADVLQDRTASCFVIPVQNMLRVRCGGAGASAGAGLMHP